MNPKLIKFTVELQNPSRKEETKRYIKFKDSGFKLLNFFRQSAKVTVPILKD